MSFEVVLTAEAEADLDEILLWSHRRFGSAVREAYEALLFAGIKDVAAGPGRVGSHDRPELGPTVRSWHLALSRHHVKDGTRRIASPRHLVVYRTTDGTVYILRLLHDAMDLRRQFVPDPEESASRE